jgi:NAD-dependent deacetylase
MFFGEPIPEDAYTRALKETQDADIFILIGTTDEIMPASSIPYRAKQNRNKIIEVNIQPSRYTDTITDIFLEGRAAEVVPRLMEAIG